MAPVERPGAALFLLAHHDDEVFCAGQIARALRAGREVRILWATAGGLAPAGRRLAEGRAVARLLGLPESGVRLLGLPDQHAVEHLARIEAEAERLLDGVDEVYVTGWEGGHPDHDAMNLVAARLLARAKAAGRPLRCHEFALYRRGRAGLAVKVPLRPKEPELDPGALALRRALIRANASQWPALGALAAAALLEGAWHTEPARPLPGGRDYARPPGPEPVLYRFYTRWDFAAFRRAAGL